MKDATNFVEVKAKFKIGEKRTFEQLQKSDQACGDELKDDDVNDDIKRKKL
jgi:hypothetical protein